MHALHFRKPVDSSDQSVNVDRDVCRTCHSCFSDRNSCLATLPVITPPMTFNAKRYPSFHPLERGPTTFRVSTLLSSTNCNIAFPAAFGSDKSLALMRT